MGFRLFVPLPGPVVFVGKSRAEKIIERQDREQRRASMTATEQFRRGVALVVLFWLLAVSWAGHYFGPGLAVVVAAVGVAHLRVCFRKERERRDREDQAVADAIAAARADEVQREL